MEDDLDAHYVLVADIDATETATWNGGMGFDPIGNSTAPFSGTFDGNGYTIANLTIDRPSEDVVGLFGSVRSGGTIRNTTLVGLSVTGSSTVGGLVGLNSYGTVSDSSATGSVSGALRVGGLVGLNWYGTVSDSSATGSVSGFFAYVGGLVGHNWYGTVSDSSATGSVSGYSTVGGLVGYNLNGTVSDSSATGSISSSSSWFSYVGGLVGSNYGRVSESSATGSVSGSSYVGGLVGYNYGGGTVSESYATGSVSGSSYVGGLVGGNNGGTVSDSYWDVDTTGQPTSAGGVGLTTAQMTGPAAATNMTGFDFVDTWRITQRYPVLAWQAVDPAFFDVTVTDTNTPVTEGELLTVTVAVENTGELDGTQTLTLTDTDFANAEQDAVEVTLAAGESNGSIVLEWPTQYGDTGVGDVTVASVNDTDTVSVTVANAPPSITALNTTAPADEGQPVSVSGTFTDPSPNDTHTVTLEWGDGTTETVPVSDVADAGTFSATHIYADDGTYTVNATVADDAGGVDATTVPNDIANVPPVLTLTVEERALFGQLVNLTTAFTDNGTADTHTASVDWGDGTTESVPVSQAAGSGTLEANHTYPTAGTYIVRVTVTDDDGGVGTATAAVTVAPLVSIEVKPGGDAEDRNPINLRSNGVIPVAILGSEHFDVRRVDAATVRFGPPRELEAGGGAAARLTGDFDADDRYEDVNEDGYADIVLHFRTQETGFEDGDSTGAVAGATTAGLPIAATDTVDVFAPGSGSDDERDGPETRPAGDDREPPAPPEASGIEGTEPDDGPEEADDGPDTDGGDGDVEREADDSPDEGGDGDGDPEPADEGVSEKAKDGKDQPNDRKDAPADADQRGGGPRKASNPGQGNDHDRGHGNDTDRQDEDNPGTGPKG